MVCLRRNQILTARTMFHFQNVELKIQLCIKSKEISFDFHCDEYLRLAK